MQSDGKVEIRTIQALNFILNFFLVYIYYIYIDYMLK